MSHRFLSYLTTGLIVTMFVACGSDDNDNDDDDYAGPTTTATRTTGSGTTSNVGSTSTTTRGSTGSVGSGGTGANSDTTGMTSTTQSTTQGSGGAAGAETSGGAGGEAGMAGAAPLSDDEVLHVIRTANLGEVEQAEIALMRADDPDVLEFAETMLEEHTLGVEAAELLAQAEELTFRPNPVSTALRGEAMVTMGLLQVASDDEFDRVYMDVQVAAHAQLLTLLEDTLIPQADHPGLQTYLSVTKVLVGEHLESAESIAEALE